MKVPIYTQKGTKTKREIDLEDNIFNSAIKEDLMAQSIYVYNSNQRQGTQRTKSRSEVSGGGRKPWRQKTPDKARHGSIRSPIWVGGGHSHAIRPRDWRLRLPKKMKQGSLFSALSYKLSTGNLKIVDKINLKDKALTKQLLEFYKKFGNGKNLLIVTKDKLVKVVQGSKSLDEVKVILCTNMSTYVVLAHDEIVILEEAASKINEIWGELGRKDLEMEKETKKEGKKNVKKPVKVEVKKKAKKQKKLN